MLPLTPGHTLAGGRYTVERSLSRGGMGAIYLATDREAFDRTVVIKTLLDPEGPVDLAEQQAAQERFLREARTLAALRFPTIPRIYSCFQDGGQTYIAMEYIAGTDLNAHLSRVDEATGQPIPGRPAPMSSVVRWGIALCRTLEYLAACEPPVVHQDIKPANLILARDSGELYLVDFGAARLRPVATPGGGKTAIFGTPGYAAPEQFQGQSEPRSDVYALAATLYHLATDDDPADHLFDFPRLSHLGYIGQILRGALQAAPARRPDATELRVQLEALQRADGNRPLRTPDGSLLFTEGELAGWLEGNWREATAWLYGALPERVEADWVRPDLARRLRQWSAPFAQARDRGLDAVLAQLDPRGFGAATPQIVADQSPLDLGEIVIGAPIVNGLQLRNVGRRYVEVTIEGPSWLRVQPKAAAIVPREAATLAFEANQRLSPSRTNSGAIVLSDADRQSLLSVKVEARALAPNNAAADPDRQVVLLVVLIVILGLVPLFVCVASVLQ